LSRSGLVSVRQLRDVRGGALRCAGGATRGHASGHERDGEEEERAPRDALRGGPHNSGLQQEFNAAFEFRAAALEAEESERALKSTERERGDFDQRTSVCDDIDSASFDDGFIDAVLTFVGDAGVRPPD
jgi:hypothetical protein